jgi:quinoprotein glucose dehydrogenase
MQRCLLTAAGVGCSLFILCSALAQHPTQDGPPYTPKVAGPSDEAVKALKRIRVPEGTTCSVWAAEPLLANPVCFAFDEKGRMFVAETFRLHAGVTDNRNHMKKKGWYDAEMACRTVDDRIAMYKKFFAKDYAAMGKEHERIRLVEDTKGAGVADKSTVFADGFNAPESGIGAGLLARKGKVWYTDIPDFWLLEDTAGKGKADVRKVLSTGYGVHTAYLGHDCHGLRMGPDGRIYFSIGDRGFSVKTGDRVLDNPDSGAVLRCDPDGSNLEIVAMGLRNPQELTFDQYGNLFTGDNNADGGDAARWVWVVDGGDSGWRLGWQELNVPMRLGPWNSEKMWGLPHEAQPAHLVPPCGHIANGPSGVTHDPGVTQLPARYKDHFFLCDFRGNGGGSGIHAFKLKARGASFQFDGKPEQFVWSVLATDCDFGPDGAFYLSDWVDGWGQTGKGRIYKVGNAERAKADDVVVVKNLLAEGMEKRTAEELRDLLSHADMRVRQEAQFEMVARTYMDGLIQASYSDNKLTRLHAIWGLAMLYRQHPKYEAGMNRVLAMFNDADLEVRCQAIKAVGEAGGKVAHGNLIYALEDKEPRVRFHAALAAARIGKRDLVYSVRKMLRDNNDQDPYLRHAGVMALWKCAEKDTILELARDKSPALRLAALLVMRKKGMAEVAMFLSDSDPRLVLEAARAINDTPINGAMPELAALITKQGMPEPLLYRVVNANFRVGGAGNANALASFSARPDAPTALRVEALNCLGDWEHPSGRDRVVGLWRPLPARTATDASEALKANLGPIFSGPDKVRSEAAKVVAKYGIKEVGPVLAEIAADTKRSASVRVETLKALMTLKDTRAKDAMEMALRDKSPEVRTQGRRMLAKFDPQFILPELKQALDKGDVIDKQGAFDILADLKQPGTEDLLEAWLDKLLAQQVPPEVRLELLEAATKYQATPIVQRLAKYEAARPKDDHLAKWAETLYGGNAENGRKIFFERSEVSCLRCHKVNGTGGEVGPDLTGIGTKQKRDYLLESIVEPDKQIAKGYETVVLTLVNGQVKTGILKSEDKKEVRLMTAEGEILVVPVAQIDTRARGPSAMPGDLMKHLSRRDLRDLVEYLSSLK